MRLDPFWPNAHVITSGEAGMQMLGFLQECIEHKYTLVLGYGGKRRLVTALEVYQTADGTPMLRAQKVENDDHRTYRIAAIQELILMKTLGELSPVFQIIVYDGPTTQPTD